MRNIFRHFPSVKKLATSHKVRKLVEPFLNYGAFAVRALYFDKTPDTNWGVGWHQDITVAVKNKRDVEGFSGWTMKAGTPTCSSSKRNIGENVDVKNFPG